MILPPFLTLSSNEYDEMNDRSPFSGSGSFIFINGGFGKIDCKWLIGLLKNDLHGTRASLILLYLYSRKIIHLFKIFTYINISNFWTPFFCQTKPK